MSVAGIQRLRLVLRGTVQGVGFRPFVFRLATELGLAGRVNNDSQGLFIEIQGPPAQLDEFQRRLASDKPPRAMVHSLETTVLDPRDYTDFQITPSQGGEKTALILPDIATCPDCLRELFDPHDRRFRYPFTNCIHCGPRYSILKALPYDRVNTTMKSFEMCPACQAEYRDPQQRRFHAQPNACPVCGPQLELWDPQGRRQARGDEALRVAGDRLRQGAILALKGLGGFQLLVDARAAAAVALLRQRKHREEKPFAVMFPSLASVREACEVEPAEHRLLGSPECPIVLLRRRPRQPSGGIGPPAAAIAPQVAPRNPWLGVMLPYTPLHHLLMADLGFPVVATSGNLSDEPMCTEEAEALQRLGGLADYFLVHNRPIARPVDDSVVRIIAGRELVLRRARGYAPLPIHWNHALPPLLAVGAHLKNTVATSVRSEIFLSQHIGDLETEEATAAFEHAVEDFQRLHEHHPQAVACDAHPDYHSTLHAHLLGLPVIPVQHHYAHVRSCMAENELTPPVLGVAWDGTGYGPDGTVWGGEFLRITPEGFQRVARMRPFPLPGGDRAIREPRRVALGLLYAMLGPSAFDRRELKPVQAFTDQELDILQRMLENGLQCPLTSSAGRLFDATAALVGLRQETRFEGQAAMELEFALDGIGSKALYPVSLANKQAGRNEPPGAGKADGKVDWGAPWAVDWEPMMRGIMEDTSGGLSVGMIAARFHNTLAEIIATVARQVGEERVVLSGGCFQNRYLTERTIECLRRDGMRVYWHQRIPPNDGGIAVGQLLAALGQWPPARTRP